MSGFSSRLPDELTPNALTSAIARLRDSGRPWIDLTATNPTVVGLEYPPDVLVGLADPAGRVYAPDPLGLPSARAGASSEFSRRGVTIPVEQIVLTASTSEAYALLFKLLCDPGDDVLVPQPSYPLFDLLTRLEGVESRPYRLDYQGSWSIDRATLIDALTPRTRAVLVVSPNNPTGSLLRAVDRDWLAGLCAERSIAIIGDEVFAHYPLSPRADGCCVAGDARALTFSLDGLSKSAGLPQVKLGWFGVTGPRAQVADAMRRLEVLADTYLSVSTPVQVAAARLIEAGRTIRAAIASRLATNLQCLRQRVAACPSVSLLEPEGGWSAVLRVPSTQTEETLVLRLLEESRVLVHPGYFFDFPTESFLVVSLLPEPAVFSDGVDRVLEMAG